MCGIVGAVASRQVSPILLEGLSRLEYRGYDSCGLCTIDGDKFSCLKTTGKVIKLKEMVKEFSCKGTTGIAHTRWATHGIPSVVNAHPHIIDNLAMVHNGIIENFSELKKVLTKAGYTFKSQTDTEVLLAYIHFIRKSKDLSLKQAFAEALCDVKGSYAIALIDPDSLAGQMLGFVAEKLLKADIHKTADAENQGRRNNPNECIHTLAFL